jgi:hypothetical protein
MVLYLAHNFNVVAKDCHGAIKLKLRILSRARRRAEGKEKGLQFLLARYAPAQGHEVVQAQAAGHFAEALSSCREKAAQQSALAELLDPRPPALGVGPEPFEDPNQLG